MERWEHTSSIKEDLEEFNKYIQCCNDKLKELLDAQDIQYVMDSQHFAELSDNNDNLYNSGKYSYTSSNSNIYSNRSTHQSGNSMLSTSSSFSGIDTSLETFDNTVHRSYDLSPPITSFDNCKIVDHLTKVTDDPIKRLESFYKESCEVLRELNGNIEVILKPESEPDSSRSVTPDIQESSNPFDYKLDSSISRPRNFSTPTRTEHFHSNASPIIGTIYDTATDSGSLTIDPFMSGFSYMRYECPMCLIEYDEGDSFEQRRFHESNCSAADFE